jgi:predicted CoA-binding protein
MTGDLGGSQSEGTTPSAYENFWAKASYAVVGHSSKEPFPKITYRELKKSGKKVCAVDPSAEVIEGDKAYHDLASLPERVDAIVIETPKEETRDWIAQAAEAGIKNVWIHMGCDTPEALDLARARGLNVCYGTCAVMYLVPGFSVHSIHKWVNKLLGKY